MIPKGSWRSHGTQHFRYPGLPILIIECNCHVFHFFLCTTSNVSDAGRLTATWRPTQPFLAGTQRTKNSFLNFWPSPRQLRVKNTLRVGHRGPVGRKTTQKPPQNTKKWKKIVKKRLFSGFGHVGQNSDFSRKKPKNGIFFDITKPPLAQIYPKSGL